MYKIKFILVLLLNLLFFTPADAQKGGLIYYLTNSGKLVPKDSADYSMLVLPPDKRVNKQLYIVYEYDKNGKVRLLTGSYTNDINLQYQGSYVSYFPDGKKKRIGSYANGTYAGREVTYYPSGTLYNSLIHLPDGRVLYTNCRDSTGKVLAENGTGDWVQFDESFKSIIAEGKIDSGMKVGEWHERLGDSAMSVNTYTNGRLTTKNGIVVPDKSVFAPVDEVPEFPGGMEAFGKFLGKTIRYPALARQNGTQGKVIVSFTVERDGTLTDIRATRHIGDGCDEEAVRVMKLSPKWAPGMQNGRPVRVAYSVPISFSIN